MAWSLLQLLVFFMAFALSSSFLSIFWLLGCLGSASFGIHFSGRFLARFGAALMVCVLAAELLIFEFVAKPSLPWAVLGYVLVAFVLWSFVMTAFTDPGTPACPEWQAWCAKQEGAGSDCSIDCIQDCPKQAKKKQVEWAPGHVSSCDRCKHVRPERAHHCKSCGTCVLRMDHHCPLIGNCVGWRNHKYYLLLQLWQLCAAVVFLFAPNGPGCVALEGDVAVESWYRSLFLDIGVCWALVIMLVSARALIFGLYTAARNETTVETNYVGKNPYYLDVARNLQQIFGPADWRLLLPVLPSQGVTEGTSFPVHDEPDGLIKPTQDGAANPRQQQQLLKQDGAACYGSTKV